MNPESSGVEAAPWREWNETRFLSRGPTVERTRRHYSELTAYFSSLVGPAYGQQQIELEPVIKYDARTILVALKDPSTFLYLTFLSPVIAEFEKLNACFQVNSLHENF